MKTKYEVPVIQVLRLQSEDVIATSSPSGLKWETEFSGSTTGGTSSSNTTWGDLFG